jgi:hypothetical protein
LQIANCGLWIVDFRLQRQIRRRMISQSEFGNRQPAISNLQSAI